MAFDPCPADDKIAIFDLVLHLWTMIHPDLPAQAVYAYLELRFALLLSSLRIYEVLPFCWAVYAYLKFCPFAQQTLFTVDFTARRAHPVPPLNAQRTRQDLWGDRKKSENVLVSCYFRSLFSVFLEEKKRTRQDFLGDGEQARVFSVSLLILKRNL